MFLDDLQQKLCSVFEKPKLIRSVASGGLTNIYKRRVSLYIYKKGANKFGRKIGFKIENESEDQNQSPVPQIAASFAEFRIFSAIFCGSPHNKCGENAELKKCGENVEKTWK